VVDRLFDASSIVDLVVGEAGGDVAIDVVFDDLTLVTEDGALRDAANRQGVAVESVRELGP